MPCAGVQVFSCGAAKGFGVRCPVALPAHAMVCEYTGQVFDTKADGGAREQRCGVFMFCCVNA